MVKKVMTNPVRGFHDLHPQQFLNVSHIEEDLKRPFNAIFF